MKPDFRAAVFATVYLALLYPYEWLDRNPGEDEDTYRARAVVQALEREQFLKEE